MLCRSKARSLFRVSRVGAGSQSFGLSSTAFLGPQAGSWKGSGAARDRTGARACKARALPLRHRAGPKCLGIFKCLFRTHFNLYSPCLSPASSQCEVTSLLDILSVPDVPASPSLTVSAPPHTCSPFLSLSRGRRDLPQRSRPFHKRIRSIHSPLT